MCNAAQTYPRAMYSKTSSSKSDVAPESSKKLGHGRQHKPETLGGIAGLKITSQGIFFPTSLLFFACEGIIERPDVVSVVHASRSPVFG